MAFHDVRLPDNIERGAQGGPRFRTAIADLASGFEKRNATWSRTRAEYDIGYSIARLEDLEDVIAFWYARMGPLYSFRFKDWTDNKISDQGFIQSAVGGETTLQLFKRYTSGAYYFDRIITRPVTGSVIIKKNGSTMVGGYSVNYDTGVVTFSPALTAADQISGSMEFDVPVRFDGDDLNVSLDIFQAGSIPNIKLVEVKE